MRGDIEVRSGVVAETGEMLEGTYGLHGIYVIEPISKVTLHLGRGFPSCFQYRLSDRLAPLIPYRYQTDSSATADTLYIFVPIQGSSYYSQIISTRKHRRPSRELAPLKMGITASQPTAIRQ